MKSPMARCSRFVVRCSMINVRCPLFIVRRARTVLVPRTSPSRPRTEVLPSSRTTQQPFFLQTLQFFSRKDPRYRDIKLLLHYIGPKWQNVQEISFIKPGGKFLQKFEKMTFWLSWNCYDSNLNSSVKIGEKVQKYSKVHVIGHLEGLCHIYLDKQSNLKIYYW